MRGGRRFALATWAAVLALCSTPVLAQSTDPQSNSPAPADAVGPRDLQNFSLSGTVTKQADQPAVRSPAQGTATSPGDAATPPPEPARRPTIVASSRAKANPVIAASPRPSAASSPAISPSTSVPAASSLVQPPTAPIQQQAGLAAPTMPASGAMPLSGDHRLLMWPWLLAAFALVAGVILLFWRNRQRHAFAGTPDYDLFVAPGPAPAPEPVRRPPPPPASAGTARAPAPPQPGGGLVSSRLRPWIELGVQPLRCIVEDHQVMVEFELELLNSGNAPARAVLAEASVFNAGPAQDDEIGAFFARPVGAGERLDTLPPLQRMNLKTKVVVPRASVQVFEVGGRKVFVPLIAFNALYQWSGGDGQTSASYLLGRDTKGDKLAPFRLDLGPRVFRNLAARPLPLGLRR